MNYYIQGDAANADKINAAFEKLGYDTSRHLFNAMSVLYLTLNGEIRATTDNLFKTFIKTHPDYKELELPVEPKFKVHDWVVDGDRVAIIYDLQKNGYVGHDINRKDFVCRYSDEGRLHLWTIADAKDGDVLATDNGWTCIFKAFDGYGFSSYCFMDSQKWFCEVGAEGHTLDSRINGNIHPATKEQRDLLFSKMKEAGYQWDSDKKELHKIINPKFKVGDNVKTGNTIETIAELDHATRRYYCESGRTIWFENQDLWHLAPKPHYDIANFHAGMPVLVRPDNDCCWDYSVFSRNTGNEYWPFAVCNGVSFTQCIPFEGNEHLLGTTDMCPEEYINW